MQEFDWRRVRQLIDQPPLADVCSEPRFVGDQYYQVGQAAYAFVSNQWDPEFVRTNDLVLALFWAPTLTAFRRLTSRNPSVVDEDGGEIFAPPPALLLAEDCVSYVDITAEVSRQSHLRFNEVELFDFSWRGTGCCLNVERLSFYFRSPCPVPIGETPFGIRLATTDDRWKSLG